MSTLAARPTPARLLAPLRSRLGALRRRRAGLRWGIALCLLTTAAVWSLAAVFLVDWWLEPGRGWRAGLLVLLAGVMTRVAYRKAWPLARVRESDADLALVVERHQQIDSDLVAALEFESHFAGLARAETGASRSPSGTGISRRAAPAASPDRYGSPQLQRAVIEYVGEFSQGLNVFQGFSLAEIRRQGVLAGASLAIALLAMLLFPAHASAFFQRLLLGSAHYPTRTQIERLVICGVETSTIGHEASVIVVPYGRPLMVELTCRGELPESAKARVVSSVSKARTVLELERQKEQRTRSTSSMDDASSTDDTAALFAGELPRLLETVTITVEAGDAYTDPRTVRVIAMPAVSVRMIPTPPAYASHAADSVATSDSGMRQLAVIEGSRVDVSVVCTNKRLRAARLKAGDVEHELVERTDASGSVEWVLSGEQHPFEEVTSPVRFSIQIEDEDGMRLERPLEGQIRLRPDKEPSIAASMVVRRVLPNARPHIDYEAADDFALSKLRVHIQVTRKDGRNREEIREVREFAAGESGSRRARGSYEIDLASLALEKDDGVKISMEALDQRGRRPSQANVSEPMVLQVTDREGIRAGVLESDEKLIRDLNAIIDLELGESK